MIERYEDRDGAGRSDARLGAPGEHAYSRRIDCADSPASRERSVRTRARVTPDPETIALRPRGPDLY